MTAPQRNTPPNAIRKGLDAAFYTAAGFAFVAALIAATCLFGIGKVGHREKKKKSHDGAFEGERIEDGVHHQREKPDEAAM